MSLVIHLSLLIVLICMAVSSVLHKPLFLFSHIPKDCDPANTVFPTHVNPDTNIQLQLMGLWIRPRYQSTLISRDHPAVKVCCKTEFGQKASSKGPEIRCNRNFLGCRTFSLEAIDFLVVGVIFWE